MAITAISRDWGINPAIVRIATTDNLEVVTTADYLANQLTTIEALNNGEFTWLDSDVILMSYDGGYNMFKRDASGNLSQFTSGILHAQVDVTLAELIGSSTASVLLVPAPGTGKKLILERSVLSINYGGTVLANGGAVVIQYGNSAAAAGTAATGTQAAATLIGAIADTTLGFTPVVTTLVDSTTLNEGLYLSTATADFTGGTLSTYKVDVWYSIVDLV